MLMIAILNCGFIHPAHFNNSGGSQNNSFQCFFCGRLTFISFTDIVCCGVNNLSLLTAEVLKNYFVSLDFSNKYLAGVIY